MSFGQHMADLVQEVLERHPSGQEKTFHQAVPFSFSCSLYMHGSSRNGDTTRCISLSAGLEELAAENDECQLKGEGKEEREMILSVNFVIFLGS